MTAYRDIAWVGTDVGKTHHWACVVDAEGKTVSSIKVANDEADIVTLIADAGLQAAQIVWAIDIIVAPSALLLALLARADQSVRCASARVVAAMGAILGLDDRLNVLDAQIEATFAQHPQAAVIQSMPGSALPWSLASGRGQRLTCIP